MTGCPRCGSTGSRPDPLRPPNIRICLNCGQTFEIVQQD